MPFINSFSINTDKINPFPFSIPAVRFAKNIQTDASVTIFVGDNGCGKSTLLETLAYAINLPLIGGYSKSSAGFEAARLLNPYFKVGWKRETTKCFFFRVEDFSDFVNGVENEKQKIRAELHELQGQVPDSIIDEMSNSMNYSLNAMRKNYGDNMQAYSHGEAYLKILDIRINGKGIYLLDEPEAALSPLKQLSLLALICEVIKQGNAQFLIATHSPILMGFPGALLYQIGDEDIQKVDYEDTDHYLITKTFLTNPDVYLHHMK